MKRSMTMMLSSALILCLSAAISWGGAPQREVTPIIRDAKGEVIGVALGHVEETVQVMMILGGVPTTLAVTQTRIRGQENSPLGVFWESSNCTGTPLLPVTAVFDAGFGGIALSSSTMLFVPKTGPSAVRTVNSLFDFLQEEMGCQQTGGINRPMIEALAFPLTIFNAFTPPFTIIGARTLP